jgi:RNA polymerase sigma-54 factor
MIQMSQRLSLQQKQSPQQVLLSTLLQLPVLRLEQRIKQELELNPLLELDTEIEEDLEEVQELVDKEQKDVNPEEEADPAEKEMELQEKEPIDWDAILNDEDNYEIKLPREQPEEEIEHPEPAPVTLMDHLMEQLHLAPLTSLEMLIGEYLLWCIDDVGYLTCELETVDENFNTTPEAVEAVLKVIQRFDPVGIGARNLRECLLIQLEDKPPRDVLAIRMLEECYEDFSNKRYEKIAKKLEISLDQVKQIMEAVSRLNPKPGERYVSEAENIIVPDVLVENVEGRLHVALNDWNMPRLKINESYKLLLKEKGKVNKETRDYIRQRLESARWLINSIYQRRSTILRVMESIVRRQREFFEKGKEYLKPMILKDIADDVSLDISTVSRVTSGKYVQTDYGIFELKYFFSERMETADGEDVSNKIIKQKIKGIIEKENQRKPFNDEEISDILRKEGFIVARRTVAKYREQSMIPVARLRRTI